MKVMFFIYSAEQQHNLHLSRLLCCNHTCYYVDMVSVTPVSRFITPASRYHPRYQSRYSMYIHGLVPRNSAELAEAVPIGSESQQLRPFLKEGLLFKERTSSFFYLRAVPHGIEGNTYKLDFL